MYSTEEDEHKHISIALFWILCWLVQPSRIMHRIFHAQYLLIQSSTKGLSSSVIRQHVTDADTTVYKNHGTNLSIKDTASFHVPDLFQRPPTVNDVTHRPDGTKTLTALCDVVLGFSHISTTFYSKEKKNSSLHFSWEEFVEDLFKNKLHNQCKESVAD